MKVHAYFSDVLCYCVAYINLYCGIHFLRGFCSVKVKIYKIAKEVIWRKLLFFHSCYFRQTSVVKLTNNIFKFGFDFASFILLSLVYAKKIPKQCSIELCSRVTNVCALFSLKVGRRQGKGNLEWLQKRVNRSSYRISLFPKSQSLGFPKTQKKFLYSLCML